MNVIDLFKPEFRPIRTIAEYKSCVLKGAHLYFSVVVPKWTMDKEPITPMCFPDRSTSASFSTVLQMFLHLAATVSRLHSEGFSSEAPQSMDENEGDDVMDEETEEGGDERESEEIVESDGAPLLLDDEEHDNGDETSSPFPASNYPAGYLQDEDTAFVGMASSAVDYNRARSEMSKIVDDSSTDNTTILSQDDGISPHPVRILVQNLQKHVVYTLFSVSAGIRTEHIVFEYNRLLCPSPSEDLSDKNERARFYANRGPFPSSDYANACKAYRAFMGLDSPKNTIGEYASPVDLFNIDVASSIIFNLGYVPNYYQTDRTTMGALIFSEKGGLCIPLELRISGCGDKVYEVDYIEFLSVENLRKCMWPWIDPRCTLFLDESSGALNLSAEAKESMAMLNIKLTSPSYSFSKLDPQRKLADFVMKNKKKDESQRIPQDIILKMYSLTLYNTRISSVLSKIYMGAINWRFDDRGRDRTSQEESGDAFIRGWVGTGEVCTKKTSKRLSAFSCHLLDIKSFAIDRSTIAPSGVKIFMFCLIPTRDRYSKREELHINVLVGGEKATSKSDTAEAARKCVMPIAWVKNTGENSEKADTVDVPMAHAVQYYSDCPRIYVESEKNLRGKDASAHARKKEELTSQKSNYHMLDRHVIFIGPNKGEKPVKVKIRTKREADTDLHSSMVLSTNVINNFGEAMYSRFFVFYVKKKNGTDTLKRVFMRDEICKLSREGMKNMLQLADHIYCNIEAAIDTGVIANISTSVCHLIAITVSDRWYNDKVYSVTDPRDYRKIIDLARVLRKSAIITELYFTPPDKNTPGSVTGKYYQQPFQPSHLETIEKMGYVDVESTVLAYLFAKDQLFDPAVDDVKSTIITKLLEIDKNTLLGVTNDPFTTVNDIRFIRAKYGVPLRNVVFPARITKENEDGTAVVLEDKEAEEYKELMQLPAIDEIVRWITDKKAGEIRLEITDVDTEEAEMCGLEPVDYVHRKYTSLFMLDRVLAHAVRVGVESLVIPSKLTADEDEQFRSKRQRTYARDDVNPGQSHSTTTSGVKSEEKHPTVKNMTTQKKMGSKPAPVIRNQGKYGEMRMFDTEGVLIEGDNNGNQTKQQKARPQTTGTSSKKKESSSGGYEPPQDSRLNNYMKGTPTPSVSLSAMEYMPSDEQKVDLNYIQVCPKDATEFRGKNHLAEYIHNKMTEVPMECTVSRAIDALCQTYYDYLCRFGCIGITTYRNIILPMYKPGTRRDAKERIKKLAEFVPIQVLNAQQCEMKIVEIEKKKTIRVGLHIRSLFGKGGDKFKSVLKDVLAYKHIEPRTIFNPNVTTLPDGNDIFEPFEIEANPAREKFVWINKHPKSPSIARRMRNLDEALGVNTENSGLRKRKRGDETPESPSTYSSSPQQAFDDIMSTDIDKFFEKERVEIEMDLDKWAFIRRMNTLGYQMTAKELDAEYAKYKQKFYDVYPDDFY